jgi:hypothetical protein
MPRQAKPAMQSPLKLLCNHLISSHLVYNRTLKRYKAERSPCQQENVCSIRSEVSSSVMTCVVFFVVPNMCFRCAEYACEERECKCPCVCRMLENEEFKCNVLVRKECLEEISNQQSNASKACTGRNTHRVRGTGELGAARRSGWACYGLGGRSGSSCDCSVAGYSVTSAWAAGGCGE